ncbi:MAG: hypothetical protein J6P44_07465 [Bacteroidales bacterium]|nr:hypothetical protein [Bacteroidales bacterium]
MKYCLLGLAALQTSVCYERDYNSCQTSAVTDVDAGTHYVLQKDSDSKEKVSVKITPSEIKRTLKL